MPHLAVPPPLKTSDGKDQSKNWAKRWNRDKKKEVPAKKMTPPRTKTTITCVCGVNAVPANFYYRQRQRSNESRGAGTLYENDNLRRSLCNITIPCSLSSSVTHACYAPYPPALTCTKFLAASLTCWTNYRLTCSKMWMNSVSGETSGMDPTSASTDRSSNATVSVNSSLIEGTIPYNRRRNTLATRGKKFSFRGLVSGNALQYIEISGCWG